MCRLKLVLIFCLIDTYASHVLKNNGTGVCKLPKVEGWCHAIHYRWYFDLNTTECQEFVYGGCMGNENNFLSRAICEATCGTSRKGFLKEKGKGKVNKGYEKPTRDYSNDVYY